MRCSALESISISHPNSITLVEQENSHRIDSQFSTSTFRRDVVSRRVHGIINKPKKKIQIKTALCSTD